MICSRTSQSKLDDEQGYPPILGNLKTLTPLDARSGPAPFASENQPWCHENGHMRMHLDA